MSKHIAAVAAVISVILIASGNTTALASFSGPWDSAHEPPTIKDPELDAGDIGGGTFSVFPVGAINFCPSSWAVTFQDPSGSVTETMVDEREGAGGIEPGYCVRSAAQATTGTPDFTVTNSYGAFTNFSLNVSPPEAPFLYMVTDATGAVIAQGAYTQIHGTFRISSGSTNFEEVCLDGHHTLYSDPSTGVIYCLNTETFDKASWPPPPAPESPVPSAPLTESTPLLPPTPVHEPILAKPKYAPLTQATAAKWVQITVEFNFRYGSRPKSLRATHCKQRAASRYRCEVSWRRGSYSFAGTVEVGSINTNTGAYTYGLHVVRTDVLTHRHRTFSVAY